MGFKDRLAEARKAKGFSQEVLGAHLGMSKQGISHWEAGRYTPDIEQLVKLCEVLECSADWLVLGKSPEGLSPDAIEQGRFFSRLSDGGKKKWRTMRLLFVDGASDLTVEAKMPATRKREFHNK
jgi:transcriptional regulator with XRE-family HTH domain